MVHCERCGAEAVIEDGYDYCVRCGLYVCSACWDERGSCAPCASELGRRTVARDVQLMRRVDRRLREVTREAVWLHAKIIDNREPLKALRLEYACLQLKAGGAERTRDRTVQRKLRPKQRAQLDPIAGRVDRHVVASKSQLAQVASALKAGEQSASTSRAARQRPANWRRPDSRRWVPAIAGAVGLAVVAVAIVLAESQPRRGTLGGVAETSAASPSARPSSSPDPVLAKPSPDPSPVTVSIAFDDQRIGSSEGWDHARANGSIGVAAFPSSFNRSIKVGSADGGPVSTCLAVQPALAFGELAVDLFIDSTEDTTAGISLNDSQGGVLLEVEISASGTRVTAADGSSDTAPGMEPAAWYRLAVSSRDEGVELSLAPLSGAVDQQEGTRLETASSGSVGLLCLETQGGPGAAAHYDNLMLESQSPLEG